jgi:hypothetical protein
MLVLAGTYVFVLPQQHSHASDARLRCHSSTNARAPLRRRSSALDARLRCRSSSRSRASLPCLPTRFHARQTSDSVPPVPSPAAQEAGPGATTTITPPAPASEIDLDSTTAQLDALALIAAQPVAELGVLPSTILTCP